MKRTIYEDTNHLPYKEAFCDLFAWLQTDYIDTMVEYEEVFSGEIWNYICEQKKTGRVHHIGMSSHNSVVSLRAVEEQKIEVLMFSLNPAYDLEDADTVTYIPRWISPILPVTVFPSPS